MKPVGIRNAPETIEQRARIPVPAFGLTESPAKPNLPLIGPPGLPDRSRLPPLPGLPPLWPRTPPFKYTRPRYAERFQCITSACEDLCCKGWSVPIDQATYEKYQSTEGLKQHVGSLIVLNTRAQTSTDYARLPLTVASECGFLDSEKMCGIQRKFGEGMLSVTCTTYPRAIATNAGQLETALNLSCPEAARVTLLDPNLLGDGAWSVPGPARYEAVRTAALSGSTAWTKKLGPRGWTREQAKLRGFSPRLAVREYVLLLLGDRRYPIWQRLYLLGLLARRLQAWTATSAVPTSVAAWCEANPGKVARLLSDSARIVVLETMRPVMDRIPMQPDQQLQLVMELLRLRFAEPPVPLRFLECVQDFELGLGSKTATSEQQILDAYLGGHRLYYKPLMERHPQMLENYLINLVFKNNYPFGRLKLQQGDVFESTPGSTPSPSPSPSPDAESEHLALCMHAALAQTLLIGIAGHHGEAFDCTHVVKLVQSLSKTMEHSLRAIEQIAEFVRAKKLNRPKGIALLLRQQD